MSSDRVLRQSWTRQSCRSARPKRHYGWVGSSTRMASMASSIVLAAIAFVVTGWLSFLFAVGAADSLRDDPTHLAWALEGATLAVAGPLIALLGWHRWRAFGLPREDVTRRVALVALSVTPILYMFALLLSI